MLISAAAYIFCYKKKEENKSFNYVCETDSVFHENLNLQIENLQPPLPAADPNHTDSQRP